MEALVGESTSPRELVDILQDIRERYPATEEQILECKAHDLAAKAKIRDLKLEFRDFEFTIQPPISTESTMVLRRIQVRQGPASLQAELDAGLQAQVDLAERRT
jgi:hypothetical protein